MQRLERTLAQSGQWFRLGVISATVVSPLFSRWRELRAAERARAVWEDRRRGVGRLWSPAEAHLPPPAHRSNLSTRLWLAGVVVGLLAAGTTAYMIARRRMRAAEEAPLELPLASANGGSRDLTEQASAILAGGAQPADAVEAAPGPRPDTGSQTEPAASLAPGAASDVQWAETGETATLPDGAPAGAAGAEAAPFVGNVRTLVYHRADAENLPAEENRTYFASAEEAETAGYHLDRGEVAGAGSE